MYNEQFNKQIEAMALSCGYDSCGIISIEKMDGFRKRLSERIKKVPTSALVYRSLEDLAGIKERFPWGKAVVICTFNYGRYQFPEDLQGKYAKGYLLVPDSNKDLDIYKKRHEFEEWFSDRGVRYAGGMQFEHSSIGSLRYAAEMAGLGIVRKNNFLYSEKGSYLELVGYVIDQECELYHEHNLKPCSEHCDICQKACPTGALCAPYTMSPLKCVSFTNTFGKGILLPGVKEEQMKEWIIGCEECQDVCPHNRKHDWSKGEEIPSLTNIAEKLLPENIIDADDIFLKREVIPRTFAHLTEKEIGTVRRCAKRSLRNRTNMSKS